MLKIQELSDALWLDYCGRFKGLEKFPYPIVKLNNRLTRTAGRNTSEDNLIELSGKFLAKFPDNMLNVILPHELAHQIDFNLNGWDDKRKAHDKKWCAIMVKIGLVANQYHSMEL